MSMESKVTSARNSHDPDYAIHECVLEIINQVVEVAPSVNCFYLYTQLKFYFPEARCWGSQDHVVTEINGSLYDKTGYLYRRMEAGDQVYDSYAISGLKTND